MISDSEGSSLHLFRWSYKNIWEECLFLVSTAWVWAILQKNLVESILLYLPLTSLLNFSSTLNFFNWRFQSSFKTLCKSTPCKAAFWLSHGTQKGMQKSRQRFWNWWLKLWSVKKKKRRDFPAPQKSTEHPTSAWVMGPMAVQHQRKGDFSFSSWNLDVGLQLSTPELCKCIHLPQTSPAEPWESKKPCLVCALQQIWSGILASDDLKTCNKVKGLVSGGSTGSALVQSLSQTNVCNYFTESCWRPLCGFHILGWHHWGCHHTGPHPHHHLIHQNHPEVVFRSILVHPPSLCHLLYWPCHPRCWVSICTYHKVSDNYWIFI